MATTRFPKGLTTAAKSAPMGDFILPDMTKVHTFWEDFDYYIPADWTVTEVGVATQLEEDADGGRLLITNAAADDDASFSQKVGESYLFETGKKLWFDCILKASDATQTDIAIGLQITDTSPFDVTDGVFFRKRDGDTSIEFVVEKNNVPTTTLAIADLADDTDIRLSFFYDGKSAIKIFAGGVQVATSVTTNLPDDEVLTISYALENGEAAAKTMSIDYIMVAKERG